MNWPRRSDSNESSSCIATDEYNPLWVSHWLVEGGGGPDLKQVREHSSTPLGLTYDGRLPGL